MNQQVALPPRPSVNRPRIEEFFIYTSPRFTVAAAGSQSQSLNIASDADFVIEKLTFQCDIAAAAYTLSASPVPNVTVLMTDAGSGRQLSNSAIPLSALFGTGQIPFILPSPKRMRANSNLLMAVSNFDAAVTYNMYLVFIGRKVYN